jgi:hypothetical protein
MTVNALCYASFNIEHPSTIRNTYRKYMHSGKLNVKLNADAENY